MTKELKEYNVVIQYDVQRTFTVYAKDEEQAEELVRSEKFENAYNNFEDNWDEVGTLEVKEVE